MEEKNAVLAALKALGDKIITLEDERDTMKLYRDIAEDKIAKLEAENAAMRHKLCQVNDYIESMEGEHGKH